MAGEVRAAAPPRTRAARAVRFVGSTAASISALWASCSRRALPQSRCVATSRAPAETPQKHAPARAAHGAAREPHAAGHGRWRNSCAYSDDDFEKDEDDSGWTRISIKDIDMGREIGKRGVRALVYEGYFMP